MVSEKLIFAIFFVLPFIYFRSRYYFDRKYFKVSGLRKTSGFQIHHLHYGAFWVLLASFLLLFIGKSIYVMALLGFGVGLIFDEFVPALLMPWDRKTELIAYEKGFIATLILFLFIILLLLVIYLI